MALHKNEFDFWLFKDTEGVIKILKSTERFSDIMTLSKNFMSTKASREHKENINTNGEETTNNSWNWSYKWISDEKTRTLFIRREEAMRSYDFDEDCDESTVPWTSFKEEIKHVVIAQRITTIGNYAFSNCTSLSSITIPDTATTIRNGAFCRCSSLTSMITRKNIAMNVLTFSECSFWHPTQLMTSSYQLKTVYFPLLFLFELYYHPKQRHKKIEMIHLRNVPLRTHSPEDGLKRERNQRVCSCIRHRLTSRLDGSCCQEAWRRFLCCPVLNTPSWTHRWHTADTPTVDTPTPDWHGDKDVISGHT